MRRHLYHILPLNPWPILSALSAFLVLSGVAFYMHKVPLGGYLFVLGLLSLIFCIFFWFSDIVDEATCSGYHTRVVRHGLRWASCYSLYRKLCFFFWLFLSFFSCIFMPSYRIGSIFPPEGLDTISANGSHYIIPLF